MQYPTINRNVSLFADILFVGYESKNTVKWGYSQPIGKDGLDLVGRQGEHYTATNIWPILRSHSNLSPCYLSTALSLQTENTAL